MMGDPRPSCTQCSVVNDTVCVHHLLKDVMADAVDWRDRAEKAHEAQMSAMCDRIEELEMQVARLRAALEEIAKPYNATYHAHSAAHVARMALGATSDPTKP